MHRLTYLILRNLRKPSRTMAPVKWFGGKGSLVHKLLPLIPQGKVYVEPYGGAASVLFHRKPTPIEVYNDLDEDLVNLFRALQNPRRFRGLTHRITWTLYSRSEFVRAVKTLKNPNATPDARAWAFFIAQNQGIGGLREHSLGSWGRAVTPSGKTCKVTSSWRSRFATLWWWHERLTKVQIECRNALEVIQTWDSPDTVFYLDPPYVQSTRKSGKYIHEMDDEHHQNLIKLLPTLKGCVILSGYDNPLYSSLKKEGWEKTSFKTHCFVSVVKRKPNGKRRKRSSRIEVVWRNQRAIELCEQEQRTSGEDR